MNTINLIVGDWGGDGHNMTNTITIKTNYTADQIRDTFVENSKNLNFLLLDYCSEYEESTINKNILDPVLQELNITVEKLNIENDYNDESYYFDSDSYARLYLAIVKYNNPGFNYKFVNSDNTVDIGGYGLFY